jgi:transcriptional regulator with XRE-family HTH domain
MENTVKKELLKTLSKEVRSARNRLNKTQSEVAEDSNVSVRALQEIEHGGTDPQASTIVSLSTALDVPVNQLLGLPMKSDLIVSIVSLLPALDEGQLRSVLRTTTGLSQGSITSRALKAPRSK